MNPSDLVHVFLAAAIGSAIFGVVAVCALSIVAAAGYWFWSEEWQRPSLWRGMSLSEKALTSLGTAGWFAAMGCFAYWIGANILAGGPR